MKVTLLFISETTNTIFQLLELWTFDHADSKHRNNILHVMYFNFLPAL